MENDCIIEALDVDYNDIKTDEILVLGFIYAEKQEFYNPDPEEDR